MNLSTTYQGAHDPFEGDRTIWLRSLPTGARVTKATVRLTPQGGPQFTETFVFDTTADPGELLADDWGITKTPTQPGLFVEVDFHARRTLAAVQGTQGSNIGNVPETEIKGASLQVDMGGAYVGIANDGTFMVPDKTPWVVTLSSEPASLPGLTANKFRLSGEPQDPTNLENATLDVTKVTIRSVPTNVSVHLGDMPPFWTRLGELPTAATSPDFADVLNAFLAEAPVENDFYAIPFVVHSDTIARLDVELAIDYVVEQPVLPPYLPEVTLPYGYSGLPGVAEELLTVDLPRGATIARTGGAVQGAFDASRIAFPKPDADGNERRGALFGPVNSGGEKTPVVIVVSPDRALAQPVQLTEETSVSGIDLPLANTEPGVARLHLALQADADGKPSGEVLTSAEVTVEKPVPGGSAWGSAPLPAEFRFEKDESEKGKRYWLVLQSVSGEACWEVAPGDPAAAALQASTDGGFSWRTAASEAGEKPLAAIYRLRQTPERFSVPLQLQIGEGPEAVRVRFDRFAPLGRVEFDMDFAAELGEYLDSPAAASPCGSGNLLVNGDFADPSPEGDATRRLFGFDAKTAAGSDERQPATVIGTVDLSEDIELTGANAIRISVDNSSPEEIPFEAGRWTVEEIVRYINYRIRKYLGLEEDIVSHDGRFIAVTSPTTGAGSHLGFFVPVGTGAGDVTALLLGIASGYPHLGEPAEIVGTKDLSDGIELDQSGAISIGLDDNPPATIRFRSGPWSLQNIVDAINEQMDLDEHVASHDETFVTLTAAKELRLFVPYMPSLRDVTEDILGIPANHYQGADGTAAQVTGTIDLSRGVDLSQERYIRLAVDNSFAVLIDCAGPAPSRTTPDQIVAAINEAMSGLEAEVAGYDSARNVLVITSPTIGSSSAVELYAWCGPQVPYGWQGVPGRLLRAGEPETGQFYVTLLALRLTPGLGGVADRPFPITEQMIRACFLTDPDAARALTGEPAELSQRISVVAGCTYLLQFAFQVDFRVEVKPSPPRWEVEWLDADGKSLGTDGGALEFAVRSGSVEAPLTAPPGAVEANVHFVCPSPRWGAVVLTLAEVAFSPTHQALRNSNFRQWEAEPGDLLSPAVWTNLSGLIAPEQDDETGQMVGVRLQGSGPEDAVLVQTAEVVAGERYELQVRARPTRPPDDDPEALSDHQRARLELHWLADDGAIGEPVILPLDGRDFSTRAWAGTAPDGAALAEIHLVQPQGRSDLLVERVSLSRVDTVSVPLTFLAEAPGELTVSDLRVTYESPGPPTEPPPRPAVPGAARRQMAAAPQPLAVRRMVEPAAPRPRSPLAEHPVGIIAGVGKRFKGLLDDHFSALLEEEEHTTTLAELAALDPGVEIDGVSYDRRLEFKAAAEIIMGIHVEAAPFATSGDESLEDLLALTPAELARRAKQPLQRAEQLQRDLRGLRFLLNKGEFRSLHLSDLMPTTG